jgi:hypothetical protein
VASFLKFLFGREAEDEEDDRASAPSRAGMSLGGRQAPVADDRLPRFQGTLGRRPHRAEPDRIARTRTRLRAAFTPAQPVTDRRLFAGRIDVLTHLIEVIENRLAHVVIFGERGIGKTSLLHILSDLARESDYLTLRATCGARSEFEVLFRTLLAEVPALYHSSVSPVDASSESGATLADLLPQRAFDARELSDLLNGVTSCHILVVLDEYDRIESESFRINIAELIKNLSDRAAPVQLVIAGVSSNLHELIGYIPSIRRNVVGLPLPKLVRAEVSEIIKRGEEASGIAFDPDIVSLVDDLSQGSPYLVRLVCYHSSLTALEQGRTKVLREDIRNGLDQMVDEAAARLPVGALQRAGRIDWAAHGELLAAVVHLAGTPSGWFSALDIAEQAPGGVEPAAVERYIGDELIPMKLMQQEGAGAESRYRFVDEGLQGFLWITLARNRLAGDCG